MCPDFSPTLGFAARNHQFRGEVQLTHELAQATITLCTDHGFQFWLGMGTMLQGWALAAQGQGEEGMTRLRQGLADWRATGAEVSTSYYLAILAEAYGKVGQSREGLRTVEEALDVVKRTEERWYEAELYRLKGELILEQSQENCSETEACFQRALDVARKQAAKSLELRAATSLAQLWQRQGKTTEAHALLAPVYEWFTEGFDTADLKDAKALLDALAKAV